METRNLPLPQRQRYPGPPLAVPSTAAGVTRPPPGIPQKPRRLRSGDWKPEAFIPNAHDNIAFKKDDIIIAVMGVTGSGKSTFISKLVPKENEIKIGHGLHSCTTEVSVYYFLYQDVRIWLVDTPGFDDTDRSDSDILKDVAFWMASVYTKEARLAGIIYLHRISDVRLGGQALKNLRMFKKLCGQNNLNSVILATTHWSNAEGVRISEQVGHEREMELIGTEGFWGGMVENGSEVMRHDGSPKSALDIVLTLVRRRLRVVLDIQTQLVDEKRSLDDTDAAQALQAELIRERKRFQEKLEQVQRDMESALEDHDKEWQEQLEKEGRLYEEKIKKTHAETEALKTNLEKIVKEKEAQFKALQDEMKQQQKKYEEDINAANASIQEVQRQHEQQKREHLESLGSLRLEHSNQMRDIERRIREESDEAMRQQLKDQQEAYEKMYERQVDEQNRRWKQQEDSLRRQEAERKREREECDRKIRDLELQTRKRSKWNPMYWLDGKYRS